MESLHPLLRPVTRKQRFYIDPKTNDAEVTAIVVLRLDGRNRHVLAQQPPDGGSLIVVADSTGRIPVFDAESDGKAYIARVFPESGGFAGARLRGLIDGAGPMRVDLDAALRWADEPATDAIGPAQAELVWDLITGADAGPARMPFDPMGMVALAEDLGNGKIDALTYGIAVTGMKIGALTWEIRRRGGARDSRLPFPNDEAIWSAAERAMLAEILRNGIAALASRLSAEAALTNVRDTWPGPEPARLVPVPTGWLLHERAIEIPRGDPPDVSELVASRLGPLYPREQLRISPEAYARYLRDREEYAEDLRAYFPVELEFNGQAQRTVQVDLMVHNAGDQKADDVTVSYRIPPGMSVVPSGSVDLNPQTPPQPLRPADYEQPDARRRRWEGRRPGYRERAETSMYNTRERVVKGPDGTVTVELPMGSVAAHDSLLVPEVWLRFDDWSEVRAFELGVEIRESGLLVSGTKIPVRVTGWSKE